MEDSAIKGNEEEIATDTAATGNEEACTEQVKIICLELILNITYIPYDMKKVKSIFDFRILRMKI